MATSQKTASTQSIGDRLRGELASFKTPPTLKDVSNTPTVQSRAPKSKELAFPSDKSTILVFLRHCGCPFAEKTFKSLVEVSRKHKHLHCIAISHSDNEATGRWLSELGGAGHVAVVVDPTRELYAQWGLGLSSTWSSLSPFVLYSAVSMGVREGIWNRPTESGSRWQTSGAFAVDQTGLVRWTHVDATANDIPDLEDAVMVLRA